MGLDYMTPSHMNTPEPTGHLVPPVAKDYADDGFRLIFETILRPRQYTAESARYYLTGKILNSKTNRLATLSANFV